MSLDSRFYDEPGCFAEEEIPPMEPTEVRMAPLRFYNAGQLPVAPIDEEDFEKERQREEFNRTDFCRLCGDPYTDTESCSCGDCPKPPFDGQLDGSTLDAEIVAIFDAKTYKDAVAVMCGRIDGRLTIQDSLGNLRYVDNWETVK